MQKLKNIIFHGFIGAIIGALITIFLLTDSCNNSSSTTSDSIDTVFTSSDTIVTTKIDTIRDTVRIVKQSEPDTVIKKVRKDKPYHTIETSYNDTLLKAKISTNLKGEFIGQSMDYELISPREKIHRIDTVTIRDSIHTERIKYRDPWRLGFGVEVEGDKNYFDIAPSVSLEKDGVQVGYEYNVFNKTHEIKILKKIDLRIK